MYKKIPREASKHYMECHKNIKLYLATSDWASKEI